MANRRTSRCTACPSVLGAAQFHVYSYGVLDELQKRLDIRSEGSEDFPNDALAEMIRRDAPTMGSTAAPPSGNTAPPSSPIR